MSAFKKFYRDVFCVCLGVGLAGIADAKTWTNAHGGTFEANFVEMDELNVVFAMEGGRRFSMPLLELSAKDQATIRAGAKSPILGLNSNFGRPWPRSVRLSVNPGCKIISEDVAKNHYIYESPGYQFHCDSRITADALANFARVFESTRAYLTELPLSLMSEETMGARSKVLIFAETASYHKAGGPVGSAGCYMSSHRLVLVPMESLGVVRGGTGFSSATDGQNKVLVHELVHQLTPPAYYGYGALGWFSEGLAEYVAATPYFSGSFRPDSHGNAVMEYVCSYGEGGKGGRALGKKISAPRLRDFMLMNYRSFAGNNANRNYGLGLLVTHYFFHMCDNGNARRITAFLKAMQAGDHGDEALAKLLGGGSWEKLEKDISDAWRKKGVELVFGGG